MKQHACVVITVFVILWGFSTQAQPEPTGNFSQLVLGGSIGALVGGVGGGLTAYGICRATTASGPWADLVCLAGAVFFGYMPGIPVGATVGVNIAGSFQKVQGNVWTALLGASLAGGIAFFVSDWALRSLGDTPNAQAIRDIAIPIVFFGVIPISAGTGAAWGYAFTVRSRTE